MGSGYVLVAIVTIVSIVMWTLPRGEQVTIHPLLTSMMEDTEGLVLLQQMIRKPILKFSTSIDRNSRILSATPIIINNKVQDHRYGGCTVHNE